MWNTGRPGGIRSTFYIRHSTRPRAWSPGVRKVPGAACRADPCLEPFVAVAVLIDLVPGENHETVLSRVMLIRSRPPGMCADATERLTSLGFPGTRDQDVPRPFDEEPGLAGPGRRVESDSGLRVERPRAPAGVRRFSHEAMATVFEVHVVHPDERYAAQAAQAAFALVDRLEGELSRFLPNSDVARINHLAAGESLRVSDSTLECLLIARHVFDLTAGAFDVSIGTGLPLLELDLDQSVVRATENGVLLDLGAIGKGYAVDLMAEVLEEWDVAVALVHGGFSSVLALDAPAGSDGWPLTLSDPGEPSRVLARPSVRQAAFGASGLRKGDHILDPRVGEPVRGRLATWVAVRRPQVPGPEGVSGDMPRVAAAAVADALATGFMILTLGEIEALCARSPGLEAWILPKPEDGSARNASPLHFGGPAH